MSRNAACMFDTPTRRRAPTTTAAAALHLVITGFGAVLLGLITFLGVALSRLGQNLSSQDATPARSQFLGALIFYEMLVLSCWLAPSVWIGLQLLARRPWSRRTLLGWYSIWAAVALYAFVSAIASTATPAGVLIGSFELALPVAMVVLLSHPATQLDFRRAPGIKSPAAK